MNKCCFYGSLRKPLYNYQRFIKMYGRDAMIYEKTTQIPGYRLYSLGQYPAAIQTFDQSIIAVDLFEVSDEAYNSIQYMELGAGYEEQFVNIDDSMYSIFLYDERFIENKNLIESGDWVKDSLYNEQKIHHNESY